MSYKKLMKPEVIRPYNFYGLCERPALCYLAESYGEALQLPLALHGGLHTCLHTSNGHLIAQNYSYFMFITYVGSFD